MNLQKIFKYTPTPEYQSTTIHMSERTGNDRKHIYSTDIYFIFTFNEDIQDWRLTYFINRFGKIIRVKNKNDINNVIYHIAIDIKYTYLMKGEWQYIDFVKVLEDE